jgi:hypothetical protein
VVEVASSGLVVKSWLLATITSVSMMCWSLKMSQESKKTLVSPAALPIADAGTTAESL